MTEQISTKLELPENKPVLRGPGDRKRLLIYGKSYTGKTYFASSFPNPLILSTDGNYRLYDVPSIDIVERFKANVAGRVQTYSAWETFNQAVDLLAEGKHGFETVIVDLVDDIYDMAANASNEKLGINDQSEKGFGRGWHLAAEEFFSGVYKLIGLPIKNIIFLSLEKEREVEGKNKDNPIVVYGSVMPDSALLGFQKRMDGTGHLTVNAKGERVLSFVRKGTHIDGGRLSSLNKDIIIPPKDGKNPSNIYKLIDDLYEEEARRMKENSEAGIDVQTPSPAQIVKAEEVELPKGPRRKKEVEE